MVQKYNKEINKLFSYTRMATDNSLESEFIADY
jgi:hypothetical protein